MTDIFHSKHVQEGEREALVLSVTPLAAVSLRLGAPEQDSEAGPSRPGSVVCPHICTLPQYIRQMQHLSSACKCFQATEVTIKRACDSASVHVTT